VSRRHWETVEEIVLGEELGFESAWLAESDRAREPMWLFADQVMPKLSRMQGHDA
jgi:hypothetical protein